MANEGRNDSEPSEETSDLLSRNRRLCFCIPFHRAPPSSSAHGDGTWWTRGVGVLKKLREWSEIVAGPRWKTFIRRFNRTKSGGDHKLYSSSNSKFQYDPLSYALNFDDGGQNGNLDEEFGFRNFSCRYASAPLPSSASKAEMGVFS